MTRPRKTRAMLATCWHEALQRLEPRRLVHDRIEGRDELRSALVVSIGKAAPAMARGAADALGPSVEGIVVTTDDTPVPDLPRGMRVMRAAHPVPDRRSVQAADTVLQLARESEGRSMLVLVSGGASSLVCAPGGITLEQKQRLTDRLLRSGADIKECNTVRRHLSRIKGGRLAEAFAGPVHSMIVSDVVQGEPHDVGSGPACPDPTTVQEARGIIRRRLDGAEALALQQACTESLKPSSEQARRTRVSVLAEPVDLAACFAAALRDRGWEAEHASLPGVSAAQLSELLVTRAGKLEPGHAWVVASEPTLEVPAGAGRGGRAGWVALHALRVLPPGTMLWAAASDGVDGSSGGGGACVWADLQREMNPALMESHLEARADAEVHRGWGTQIPGGATGMNLTDLYAVMNTGERG